MSQEIFGINNYISTTQGRNTLEDFSTQNRTKFSNEGIIKGLRVKATSTPSAAVDITAGEIVIDCGNGQFMSFRLKTAISSLAVPTDGTAKYFLVALEISLTNATAEIKVFTGTAGTDPDLPEAADSDLLYYVVLARIQASTSLNISDSQIVQNGSTQTNNSTPEIIGRIVGSPLVDGWTSFPDNPSYVSATNQNGVITIPGDYGQYLFPGDKIKFVQSGSVVYNYITSVSVSNNITTLNISGDSVTNNPITSMSRSLIETPRDFPDWFDLTPIFSGNGGGTVPTYNGSSSSDFTKFRIGGRTVEVKGILFGSTGDGDTPGSGSNELLLDYPISPASHEDAATKNAHGDFRSGDTSSAFTGVVTSFSTGKIGFIEYSGALFLTLDNQNGTAWELSFSFTYSI